mgnify:CR=1 FL=1
MKYSQKDTKVEIIYIGSNIWRVMERILQINYKNVAKILNYKVWLLKKVNSR